MIRMIIISVGVVIEEIERRSVLVQSVDGSHYLSDIIAILRSIHHSLEPRHQIQTYRYVCINACCHAMSTFGIDKYDTICTTSTIKCRRILQHGNFLNISRHHIGQHIVEISAMQHVTAQLHIHLYTVYDYKRLCIGIDRVHTAHKHCISKTDTTRTLYGTEIARQIVLYL